MMISAMFSGAIAMAAFTISLFFFRFWKSTHDRFFLFFGLSFLLEGLNRVMLGFYTVQDENASMILLIRLTAYLLIIIAIIDKNYLS